MKKAVPYIIAFVLFLLGVLLAMPSGKATIVVAARDLPAGHVLQADDLQTAKVSSTEKPRGAYAKPEDVVGKALRVPRVAGDPITASAVGGAPDLSEELKPNERLVAVKVSLSSGLAGLLSKGDTVGVTMVWGNNKPYAKAVLEGLRVVYVDPAFRAKPEDALTSSSSSSSSLGGGAGLGMEQATEGVIALAVPTPAQAVVYSFPDSGVTETRYVNAVELLSALDQTGAKLSLYLVPKKNAPLVTSGLFLPDLVVTPPPTPTPTASPIGGEGGGK